MIIQLLLLASCQPPTEASTNMAAPPPVTMDAKTAVDSEPAPVEIRIPEGQAVVRQCYATEHARRKSYGANKGASPAPTVPRGSYYGGSGGASNSAPAGGAGVGSGGYASGPSSVATGSTSTKSAQPAPPPVVYAAPDASAVAESIPVGAQPMKPATAKPTPSAPKMDAKKMPYAVADANDDEAGGTSARASAPKQQKEKSGADKDLGRFQRPAEEPAEQLASTEGNSMTGDGAQARHAGGKGESKANAATDAPEREEDRTEMAAPMDNQPVMDWGATVYLSNDDSMSLASAQRLLWAVQNKGPVQTSEVRPHEFLNYFSFDTSPVHTSDTFSVLASAEETAPGTLTMAFAVKGVTPPRNALDLTIVLDRSGSMAGEGRMEYLKRGLNKMESQLQRGDRVDLVLFDDSVCTPLENFVVGRDDPALLTDAIADLQPRGSTDLDAGLREGYRIANARTDAGDRNRRMLLISDALLNTGEVDTDVVSEIGKSFDASGIRLSAVGVGRDFNDKVLDQLSEKGKGAYVYLGSEAVVDRIFGPGFDSLTSTIAHDVHFALDLPDSLAMERFYGEESSTVKADVQPIDYYAGTTQLFLQDLKVKNGIVANDPVKLTVEWSDVNSGKARSQVFTSTVGRLIAADSRNLHKGRALMAWTDLIVSKSLGANPCGEPFSTWEDRVGALGDDAEIAWLDGLTAPLCGRTPATVKPVAKRGVPYKVKVDSDTVIAEVGLECDGGRQRASIGGSDSVARFEVEPGSCSIVLYGAVPMVASVSVPKTGGDIRCMVRGGRMSCG